VLLFSSQYSSLKLTLPCREREEKEKLRKERMEAKHAQERIKEQQQSIEHLNVSFLRLSVFFHFLGSKLVFLLLSPPVHFELHDLVQR
jgi:hypothetical protein